MTLLNTQTSISEQDLARVKTYCANNRLKEEDLYVAVWLYTLSIYSAASKITTLLCENSVNQDALATPRVSSITTDIGGHMKINELIRSLSVHSSPLDIETCLELPAEKLFKDSTVVGIGDDEVFERFASQIEAKIPVCGALDVIL
jgi:hypothetical protein